MKGSCSKLLSRGAVWFVSLSLCLGWPVDTYPKDLVVKEGATVHLSGSNSYDNLFVEGGATLVLNDRVDIECNRFSLGGKIILSGDTRIYVLYGLNQPNSKDWAMRVVPSQAPYPNNFQPQIVQDHPAPVDGAEGNPGAPGSLGLKGYELELIVHGNLQIDSTQTTATQFAIKLGGQSGGRGGNAIGGGNGGDGGMGGGGGNLKVTVTGEIVANPSGWLFWNVNGGSAGGNSGNDAPEDLGGGGGNGGQGGTGGLIEIKAARIHKNIGAKLEANGGNAGFGGCAYNPDPAGEGGRGADGGRIVVRVREDLSQELGWWLYANGGFGTRPGNCSCNSCYYWDSSCVCHQLNNQTGQGGNGGHILVSARDIDNLGFYASGGNGGGGLSAHNLKCSYDGASCLWGSYNGIRIGDGGDGASAGNGGSVTLISSSKNVANRVTYTLRGGEPGIGGRGGAPGCSGPVKTCCTLCPSGSNGSDGSPGHPGGFGVKRQGGTVLVTPLLFRP